MPVHRPLLTIAAMLVIVAKSALATTPVEVARAQEPAAPATADDFISGAPKRPLAVPVPLTPGDPGLQIQLGSAEPPKSDASVLQIQASPE